MSGIGMWKWQQDSLPGPATGASTPCKVLPGLFDLPWADMWHSSILSGLLCIAPSGQQAFLESGCQGLCPSFSPSLSE